MSSHPAAAGDATSERAIAKLWNANCAQVWHQFTQMADYTRGERKFIVKGDRNVVYDHTGKEYIDGLAGLFSVQIGHGRSEIADLVHDQICTLAFYSLFGFSNVPAVMLASKLAEIAPGALSVSFFNCSGSEAVEVALKIARQYQMKNKSKRSYKFIARRMSFHGVTMGALSANGFTRIRAPYEPLVPGFRHLPPPNCYRCELGESYPNCDVACARSLEQMLEFEDPETVAAVIAEPVQAVGGIVVPPKEYFPTIREICDRHNVLLIADEVLTGFGRTGAMFGSNHSRLAPDIMTLAKGISSGYIPLSATITRPEIADSFCGDASDTFQHGATYSGHPVACRVGLRNIEIIEEEKLVENSADVGTYLKQQLEERLAEHRMVGKVSGQGLLLGVELVKDKASGEALPEAVGEKIRDRIFRMGLICRFQVTSLVLAPCLTLSRGEADRIAEIIEKAIRQEEKEMTG